MYGQTKLGVSSTVNALKRYQTWGIGARGFNATYGENKIDKL